MKNKNYLLEPNLKHENLPRVQKYIKSHPKEKFLENLNKRVKTRLTLREQTHMAFSPQIEHENIDHTFLETN